jgi:uridine phosphorylase/DNA-binding MarR family transcriptional regulator
MDFEVTDQNFEELTLLLLYLTSWREKVVSDLYIQRAWKGYDFGILNKLEEKGYITSSKRAKSVHLTDEGIEQAKAILKKFQPFLSGFEAPILQQDLDDEAIVHPKYFAEDLKSRSNEPEKVCLPSRCVATFSYLDDLIKWLKETRKPEELDWFSSRHIAPLKFSEGDVEFCVTISGVGAAHHAAHLEELIELGVRECVLFGGAGVLNPDIPRGDVIIPKGAIREEGVSYHYLSPSTYVESSSELTEKLIEAFRQKGFPMHIGDTWTTDAIYRETKKKIARYREAGVLSVEMEAAAHFAVAKYRRIEAAAVFYAGDCIGGDEWDRRKDAKHSVQKEEIMEVILACFRK